MNIITKLEMLTLMAAAKKTSGLQLLAMKLAERNIRPMIDFAPQNNQAKRWDAAIAAGQRNIDRLYL
jgi:hypothetical protein